MLSAADLVYPSIQFISINYSQNFIKFNLMGCINIGNLKIYEMDFNFEEILKTREFNTFLKKKIDYDNTLNNSFKDYNENKKILKEKKEQMKKDDEYLLQKYYCFLCHKFPRNVLIKNCNHFLLCENCVKDISVCPKCGLNIVEHIKIYR